MPSTPDGTFISQPELISAILRHLDKQGVKNALPRQINAVIKAADDIIAEFMIPARTITPGMGVNRWLHTDEVGQSSKYMAFRLTRGPLCDYNYPHDPSDFGRCLGLLIACPELRDRVPEMAAAGPEWAALVRHWGELETLYHAELPTGEAPKLYARMVELLEVARAERAAQSSAAVPPAGD